MGVYSGMTSIKENASASKESAGHILDMIVENENNSMNMFNSVISLDFSSAYNEAGYCYISEEAQKAAKEAGTQNIFKKIGELITTFKNRITEAFATFFAKIENLISNDEKLTKKYDTDFDKNSKSYTLKNYRPLKPNAVENYENAVNEIVDKYNEAINGLDKATSKDEVNNIVSSISNEKGWKDKVIDNVDSYFFGKKQASYILTDEDNKNIKGIVHQSKGIIEQLNNFKKKVMKPIIDAEKEQRSSNRQVEKDMKKGEDINLIVANGIYKVVSAVSANLSKIASTAINAASRYIAAARKTYVQIASGKLQKKEEAETKKNNKKADTKSKGSNDDNASEDEDFNEAYVYMIGEASDMYVSECLAMF